MAKKLKRGQASPELNVVVESTPIAEAVVAEKPKPQKTYFEPVKRPKIIRKEKVFENRNYTIPKGGGIVYMLSSKGITVYDEEKNQVREIRYCPNEPSIWRDEQSDNARKEAVIFNNGNLLVPKSKPNLMEYLDRHPDNIDNGGHVFSLIKKEQDAAKKLAKEFSVNEAIAMVRDTDLQELLPVAMYYSIDINRPTAEIRYDLLTEAKSNPEKFISSFDNPMVKTRSMVYQASQYQIINLKEEGCYWYDSNRLIIAVPTGQKPLDTLTRYCMTEKGASVLASIEDSLSKLG